MRVLRIVAVTATLTLIAELQGQVSELTRRISYLENPPGAAKLQQHEAWTAPPTVTGPLGATYWSDSSLAISDGTVVALVPIRNLVLPMNVRRLSAVIVHGTGAGAGTYSMALYRMEKPRAVRDAAAAITTAPRFVLIAGTGGVKLHVSTTAARFNVTFDREVTIDPADGFYFVGLSSNSSNCLWHVPAAVSPGAWTSFSAPTGGAAIGAFPDTLTGLIRGNFVPAVVLRSTLGIHLFGDSNYD